MDIESTMQATRSWCQGDTTYAPNLVAHAKDVDLLIHCLAVASRQLEAVAPDYVNHFYEYLANPEMARADPR